LISSYSDIALVKNNARVGSAVAINLASEMNKHILSIAAVPTTEPRPTTVQRIDEDRQNTTCAKAIGTIGNIVSFSLDVVSCASD